ncbi:MAG: acyltransferase [Methylotenera sp.]|nr:acyltransferase [Methylotenera sp.]
MFQVKLSRSLDNPLSKSNNFDLLRFVFAFIVCLVHAHTLSGVGDMAVFSRIFSSEIAVKCFFVVSGFLIFMSYENSKSIKAYFIKRLRRIYPAYFLMVLLCVLMGALFSTYSTRDYWLSFAVLKYLAANLTFLNFIQPTLPGVFENNSYQAVNGALWTLKIEVMFYLAVPLIVAMSRKFQRLPVLIGLYICSVFYSLWMIKLHQVTGLNLYLELQRQLPGQLTYFIAGAAGFYYHEYFKQYQRHLIIVAIIAFCLKALLPWIAVEPIALAIAVVYFACIFQCVGNFGKYGDFSYGVYITHFPILQLLISFGLFKTFSWITFAGAVSLILLVSALFWNFIEKPFLRKSSHYVAVSK